MNRLTIFMRRWGNDGAVANARTELVHVDDEMRTAMSVEQRVRHRDTAIAAGSLIPSRRGHAA